MKIMIRIWEKSELWFALLWIAVYMTGNSLSAELPGALGTKSYASAVFHVAVSLSLFFWVRENGLAKRYGLCKADAPASQFLWYIPLVVLPLISLWNGVTLNLSITDAVFSICSMIGVGFLEELLFRGFLFRAASHGSVKMGIVISSVSFGLGHIFNLVNDRGTELPENIWQVIFATAFGFLCAIIFCRGGSLRSCILAHSAFNVASVFAKDAEITVPMQILRNTASLVLVIGYAWFLASTLPEGYLDSGCERPPKTQ